MKTGNTCPICGKTDNRFITRRENIPIVCNRRYDNREEAIRCQKENQEYALCLNCGLVWNRVFDDSIQIYDNQYNNSQVVSESYIDYMESSIQFTLKNYDHTPKKIVEIGCGRNADYIRHVKKHVNHALIIGYDPACVVSMENRGILLEPRYYNFENEDCKDVDWLISRHVIEHLNHPMTLFKNVLGLRKDNKNAVAFFETPDVSWILRNSVVFDYSYEHCSLFSKPAFYYMAKELNLSIDKMMNAFDDQYLWVFAKNANNRNQEPLDRLLEILTKEAETYTKNEEMIFSAFNDFIAERKKFGTIAVWGAAGKGNIFLNLFDPKCQNIEYLVDKDLTKQEKYISGTGHKVESPNIINNKSNNIKTVIIMNEKYEEEIKKEISDDILVITADGFCRDRTQ